MIPSGALSSRHWQDTRFQTGLLSPLDFAASVFPCDFFFRMGPSFKVLLSKKIPRWNACMPRATYLGVSLDASLWRHANSDGLCGTFFPFHDTKVFLFRYISAAIWRGVQPLSYGIRVTHVQKSWHSSGFYSMGFVSLGSKRGFNCFHYCASFCFTFLVILLRYIPPPFLACCDLT